MELIGWILVLTIVLFAMVILSIAFLDLILTESSIENVVVTKVLTHYNHTIINGQSVPWYSVTVRWRGIEYSYNSLYNPFKGDTIDVRITRGRILGWFTAVEDLLTSTDIFEGIPVGFDNANDWWDSMDKEAQISLAAKVKKSAEFITDDEIIYLYVTEYVPQEDTDHKSFSELKSLRANKCKVLVTYTDTNKAVRECTLFIPIPTKGVNVSNEIYKAGEYIHIVHSYVVLEYYDGLGNTLTEQNYYE